MLFARLGIGYAWPRLPALIPMDDLSVPSRKNIAAGPVNSATVFPLRSLAFVIHMYKW